MKKRNSQSLWIIIFTALWLVAIISLLGYQSFKATEKIAFAEFNQRQLVLAKAATSGLELYFQNLAGDLRSRARLPEIQHFDETSTRREIQYMLYELQPWGVNDIAVIDAAGIVRYGAVAHQLEGVDFSWRDYFQEAKKMTSSETYIIEFIEFKGVEAGQKGVLMAVPMFKSTANDNPASPSGEFAGVIVCTLKLDTVTQKFIAPIQASANGYALLIDDQHNVLWSPAKSIFGKNLLAESERFPTFQQIVAKMAAGNIGTSEYTFYNFESDASQYTTDTAEKLIAYAPVRLGKELWSVGVWAPKEDARQLIRSAYFQQLFVVGLSVLIIFLGSAHSLAVSLRMNKFLKKEVEIKYGELEESHARLITVLDSLEAIVYVADIDTYEILFANKYVKDLWGDVVGKICWHVLQSGQSGPCELCTTKKLLVSGSIPNEVSSWEFQNTANGRWYEIRDRAIHWVDDRIVRLETAIDITERKQAEQALQAIIDTIPEPSMIIGPDYQIKLINKTAREFSIGAAAVLEPLYCYQISHQHESPCKGAEHPCPMKRVRELGQPVTVVHKHYDAHNRELYVEVTASPLWEADGTFMGIIETIRDITEYKSIEKTLAQQAKIWGHSDNELEEFTHKVARSLQNFFTKLE